MYRYIVPGVRAVEVISATAGSVGEQILRKIAQPRRWEHTRNQRLFGEWQDGCCQGVVRFNTDGETASREFPVTLKLGVEEGLVLRDVNGRSVSIKDRGSNHTGGYVIEVGRELPERHVEHIANQIVGCWVVHGFHWLNRVREVCNWPYGNDVRRPVASTFRVVDGGELRLTLGDLVARGAVRSTHAGQWNRPYTLVPALCGMVILIHEFKQSGEDVCMFKDRLISNDAAIWGPYCRWAERRVGEVAEDWLRNLAAAAASPFAFHLHATRRLFPNCTLNSTYLVRQLGESKLSRIVDHMVAEEPERVYRLIDASGVTRRLVRVTPGELVFDGELSMRRADVAGNVVRTFRELMRVEEDIAFDLPRIPRAVLDSHFYVVVSGLAESSDFETAYHLSGSEMYHYLVDGKDAAAHRIRNERLFQLLKPDFGIDRFKYHIFPGVAAPGPENQYTVAHERFDLKELRSRVV